MATVRSYRDLIAWQKAMGLVKEIYTSTQAFPKDERFGLVGQLRRAAVSIPSNIAEGQGKSSGGEFKVAIGHAMRSLFEVETQLLIARDLGYVDDWHASELLTLTAELGRILNGLLNSLPTRVSRRTR